MNRCSAPAASFPRRKVTGIRSRRSFPDTIGHGWTYSSHPLCAAAGVANLEVVDELDLVANARDVGAYFKNALNDAVGSNRFVGEVRGEGMMAAIEFVVTATIGCFRCV